VGAADTSVTVLVRANLAAVNRHTPHAQDSGLLRQAQDLEKEPLEGREMALAARYFTTSGIARRSPSLGHEEN
jgi:hypothetical protein